MCKLWNFCTFVLIIFYQYLHISSSSLLSADLFQNWLKEHGKKYTSEQEKQYRMRILRDNHEYITRHNSRANSSYTLSLNAFADLTHHEFKAKYLLGWPFYNSTTDLESSSRVGICASDRQFQFYSQGIFTGPCCDTLDHSVFFEGYDHSTNGVDYWNVKNSWGTKWGINGYMHLAKWNGKKNSSCAIYNNMEQRSNKTTKTSTNSRNGHKCFPLACSEEETCCCFKRRAGFCTKGGCCDPDFPVCCKIHRKCCPEEYPNCKEGNRTACFKKLGNTILTVPGKMAVLHARLSH